MQKRYGQVHAKIIDQSLTLGLSKPAINRLIHREAYTSEAVSYYTVRGQDIRYTTKSEARHAAGLKDVLLHNGNGAFLGIIL